MGVFRFDANRRTFRGTTPLANLPAIGHLSAKILTRRPLKRPLPSWNLVDSITIEDAIPSIEDPTHPKTTHMHARTTDVTTIHSARPWRGRETGRLIGKRPIHRCDGEETRERTLGGRKGARWWEKKRSTCMVNAVECTTEREAESHCVSCYLSRVCLCVCVCWTANQPAMEGPLPSTILILWRRCPGLGKWNKNSTQLDTHTLTHTCISITFINVIISIFGMGDPWGSESNWGVGICFVVQVKGTTCEKMMEMVRFFKKTSHELQVLTQI